MLGPPLRSPVCICRASKPVHQSMVEEVGFIFPHREGFHRNCRPALVAPSLPSAAYLPVLLFRHPAMGQSPAPVPGPSQSEALRVCGKQAGLRGRRLQMTLNFQLWQNPYYLGFPLLFCKSQCLGFIWERKEDFGTSSWCFSYT